MIRTVPPLETFHFVNKVSRNAMKPYTSFKYQSLLFIKHHQVFECRLTGKIQDKNA